VPRGIKSNGFPSSSISNKKWTLPIPFIDFCTLLCFTKQASSSRAFDTRAPSSWLSWRLTSLSGYRGDRPLVKFFTTY